MKKYLGIALMLAFVSVSDGIAQSGSVRQTPPSTVSRKSDFSFVLTKISTVEVGTHDADGRKLPGTRARIIGSYIPNPPPCAGGALCPQVLPAPVQLSVFLRSWEYRSDTTKAHTLNVCLRSIESASPESRVILRGAVTHDTKANVVVMHSISSCFVGSSARIY
jgi:hypothetical protein